MNLKEKFSLINCDDCDIPYCEIKCTILSSSELNHLEKIADNFAIEFAQWIKDEGREIELLKGSRTPTKLLEIYKKEKAL